MSVALATFIVIAAFRIMQQLSTLPTVLHEQPHEHTSAPFASKAGWAALLLHRHRPSNDLRGFAEATAQTMMRHQNDDGSISVADWPQLESHVSREVKEKATSDWVLTALAVANDAA